MSTVAESDYIADPKHAEEIQNQKSRLMGFKIISWAIWGFMFFVSAQNIYVPFIMPSETKEFPGNLSIFLGMLFFAVVLISCFTFVLYYYTIHKPYKRGNYNPTIKPGRYIAISIINYFLVSSNSIYGLVIFFLSGLIWPHIILCLIGVSLFIFHRPKYKLFETIATKPPPITDFSGE